MSIYPTDRIDDECPVPSSGRSARYRVERPPPSVVMASRPAVAAAHRWIPDQEARSDPTARPAGRRHRHRHRTGSTGPHRRGVTARPHGWPLGPRRGRARPRWLRWHARPAPAGLAAGRRTWRTAGSGPAARRAASGRVTPSGVDLRMFRIRLMGTPAATSRSRSALIDSSSVSTETSIHEPSRPAHRSTRRRMPRPPYNWTAHRSGRDSRGTRTSSINGPSSNQINAFELRSGRRPGRP